MLAWVANWPEPSLSANQVLVRCLAGGLNPKDVLLRKGKFSRTLAREPLPRVSGLEIAGEVLEVGRDVTTVRVGQMVYGMTNNFCGGIHSERAVLSANEVAGTPSNITPGEAAAIPLAAQTALQALRDISQVGPQSRVLINGASGGVGHFAVQIGKALGAEVHAVCGPAHLDFVAALGADVVYDYTVAPAPALSESFDVVFDVFGKYSKARFASQLGGQGIFVSTVPKPVTLWGEVTARLGFSKRSRLVRVRSVSADLDQIHQWVAAKQVMPHIERVYPVTSAPEAHRHIESRHTTGKIILSFTGMEKERHV